MTGINRIHPIYAFCNLRLQGLHGISDSHRGNEPCKKTRKGGVMPRNSSIHKVSVMRSYLSNDKEADQSLYGVMNPAGRQNSPGQFAVLSDTVLDAMFAPCEAWLQMVLEYHSAILKTYQDLFWSVPALCVFPSQLVQRSFACYIESIGWQSKAANLPASRVSAIRGPVDSIESAMDVAIGADREPRGRSRTATAA